MKNECNIVKDLLPLCIDGAASEDSRELVDEHTARCEDCARERREMMVALPKNPEPQEEQAMLEKAARKLRRKHMRRGGVMTIIGLLMGIALMIGGRALFHNLRYVYNVRMPLDSYNVRLSILDDRLLCSVVQVGREVSFAWGSGGDMAEDGSGYAIDLYALTTRLPSPSRPNKTGALESFEWRDGKIYDRYGDQIVSITRSDAKGTKELIYQYGVDESRVQPASEEMRAYFQLQDEFVLYRDLQNASKPLWAVVDEDALPFELASHDREEISAHVTELQRRMEEVAAVTPEWQ